MFLDFELFEISLSSLDMPLYVHQGLPQYCVLVQWLICLSHPVINSHTLVMLWVQIQEMLNFF